MKPIKNNYVNIQFLHELDLKDSGRTNIFSFS